MYNREVVMARLLRIIGDDKPLVRSLTSDFEHEANRWTRTLAPGRFLGASIVNQLSWSWTSD